MISRREMKQRAKAQLGGNIFKSNWLMALLLFIIYSAIMGIGTGFSAGIVSTVLSGALLVGISGIFISLVRFGKSIELEGLFSGFTTSFVRNFLLSFLSTLFIALWSLLLIIPGIVKSYAYSMCYYIAADHPEYTWKQCIDESIKLTKGHKSELFVLDLSFIGWYILGALALGIGVLWVTPYHNAVKANYYEALINAPEQQQ